ncbi:hypothetical protein LGL55_13240 [Clostridium tagluense]|uniref:hypothetical protein n=1 Tax=Clostridium tagluense TaxID=360422 RepID=UPI001CF4C26F|nr:hypothetical protein [Clostridium tagluense]MCB2312332.1 hypothetical protein [Clostridium tagluense]MCB2316931.1 hypothetical protein [Clostridium tagluense]MCB2321871.1 hypothetical protein [Clostridium tagluense]MCB2326710.1 hypothetical protein [Clostridium tagluense]MCB2331523.1 hypothetical protein [Clostridium tagluense]
MVTDGFLPLEHPPGEAQVDFGEARFIEKGITYDGNYLNISYPHSNSGYMCSASKYSFMKLHS